MWFFTVLFIVLGIMFTINPKASWLLSNWWKLDGDAEPSRFSLSFYRLGGIVYLIAGIICLSFALQ